MSAYVVLGTGRPSRVADVVLSLLRMQAPSSSDSPGLCATDSLTSDGKVGLEVGLQLGVGLVMVVLVLMSRWLGGCRGCPQHRTRRTTLDDNHLHVGLLNGDYGGDATSGPGPSRMHSLNVLSRGNSAIAASGADTASPASDGTQLPPRARYVTAVINFGVTAYSTVTVATIKMLHCVWVPGTPPHQRRLFIRGTVVCDYTGWQAPHMAVLAALVAVPLVLPLAAAWSRRRGPQQGRDRSLFHLFAPVSTTS
jgi:hypothetical protein